MNHGKLDANLHVLILLRTRHRPPGYTRSHCSPDFYQLRTDNISLRSCSDIRLPRSDIRLACSDFRLHYATSECRLKTYHYFAQTWMLLYSDNFGPKRDRDICRPKRPHTLVETILQVCGPSGAWLKASRIFCSYEQFVRVRKRHISPWPRGVLEKSCCFLLIDWSITCCINRLLKSYSTTRKVENGRKTSLWSCLIWW